MGKYILASRTIWPVASFMERRSKLPGEWVVVSTPEDLGAALCNGDAPRYVFLPHWSHIIPNEILSSVECVCFHMTDVPYGRGGSPLQNLIARGHLETKLTALRMTDELDAGPVYRKQALSLEGSATEIFERAAGRIMDMIEWMVAEEPTPVPQEGEPTCFKRRKPEQSRIPPDATAQMLYDHIRMLDAAGYPHAFCETEGWRVEFTGASLDGDVVTAQARFVRSASEAQS